MAVPKKNDNDVVVVASKAGSTCDNHARQNSIPVIQLVVPFSSGKNTLLANCYPISQTFFAQRDLNLKIFSVMQVTHMNKIPRGII